MWHGTLNVGDKLHIGEVDDGDIKIPIRSIEIIKVQGGKVKVSVTAPDDVRKVKAENPVRIAKTPVKSNTKA